MSTSCELKLGRDEKLAMHEKFQRFSTVENYEKYLNSEYIDGLLIGRTILDADNLIKIGK